MFYTTATLKNCRADSKTKSFSLPCKCLRHLHNSSLQSLVKIIPLQGIQNFHTPFRDASSVILEPENQKSRSENFVVSKNVSSQQALSVIRTALLTRVLSLPQGLLQSEPALCRNFDSTPRAVEGVCSSVSGNPNFFSSLSSRKILQ